MSDTAQFWTAILALACILGVVYLNALITDWERQQDRKDLERRVNEGGRKPPPPSEGPIFHGQTVRPMCPPKGWNEGKKPPPVRND